MHQGQIPAPQPHNVVPQFRPHESPSGVNAQPPLQPTNLPIQSSVDDAENASSLDDLIASASKQADANAAAAAAAAAAYAQQPATALAPAKEDAGEDKGAKKDKEKPKSTRLVYSDNETSPEEKMAMMAKYAFTPAQKTILV